jgi:hypothetical protein
VSWYAFSSLCTTPMPAVGTLVVYQKFVTANNRG